MPTAATMATTRDQTRRHRCGLLPYSACPIWANRHY
jgi:hypothetical protein